MKRLILIPLLLGSFLLVPCVAHGSAEGCCIHRGDVDYSGGPNSIDISDIVFLVNYIFMGGPEPPCLEQADINDTGGPNYVDIADLAYLVDYMFSGGPEPVPCKIGPQIAIPFGESFYVPELDLIITFEAVISDSRCPVDAFCFWEGSAEILMKLTDSADIHYVVLPIMGGISEAYGFQAMPIEAYGYRLTLHQLIPMPELATGPIPDEDYTAIISVDFPSAPVGTHGEVIPTSSTWISYQTPDFTFDSAWVSADTLNIKVSYSGGCRYHYFSVYMHPAAFAESFPPRARMYILQHNDYDPCDAWITETRKISLGPVIDLYIQHYGQIEEFIIDIYDQSVMYTP